MSFSPVLASSGTDYHNSWWGTSTAATLKKAEQGDSLELFSKSTDIHHTSHHTMDCTWAHDALLFDETLTDSIPEELRNLLSTSSGSEYLDALAAAALRPSLTTAILTYYEPLFPDLCARWLLSQKSLGTHPTNILSAFARVLPFAPYLAIFAEKLVSSWEQEARADNEAHTSFPDLSSQYSFDPGGVHTADMLDTLLTLFRLLQFDHSTFARVVSPSMLQSLFQHDSSAIRYLSIRVFCLYLRAADALTLEVVKRYTGNGEIKGDWELRVINYRFLASVRYPSIYIIRSLVLIQEIGCGKKSFIATLIRI